MKNPRAPILAVMAAIVLAGAPRIWAQQASPAAWAGWGA